MAAARGEWARRALLTERVLFLGPGLFLLACLSIAPLALIAIYSFMSRSRFGGVEWAFSVAGWRGALGSTYVTVLGDSVAIAAVTTALAIALGFPLAYVIANLSPRWRMVALVAVVLPFLTNFLIRIYAWIVLLNSAGPVNQILVGSGLLADPFSVLYTDAAIVIGLLYAYLPLMVLPIYASLANLPQELGEAAVDLGANSSRVFRDVYIPLSLPGIITGSIFVFVPSMGNFVVPDLLGGGKTILLGNLLRDQFLEARDWPLGSVLAVFIVAVLAALFAVQAAATRRLTGKLSR